MNGVIRAVQAPEKKGVFISHTSMTAYAEGWYFDYWVSVGEVGFAFLQKICYNTPPKPDFAEMRN